MIIAALQSSRILNSEDYDTLVSKCLLHAARLLKRPDQCRAMTNCSCLYWHRELSWRELPLVEQVKPIEKSAELETLEEKTSAETEVVDGDKDEDVPVELVPIELYCDSKKLLETLQRSLKIADSCLDPSIHEQLFIEILNRYLYFFEIDSTVVSAKYVEGLVDLIRTSLSGLEQASAADAAVSAKLGASSALLEFDNIQEYIGRYWKCTMGYLERRVQLSEEGRLVDRFRELEL